MKFRAKLTIAMVLLSLTYGIGGSLMIAQSFSASIDRERDAAVQTYRMVVDVLDLLGDNASPGTAANTVALSRARNTAAVQNMQRFDGDQPCHELERCVDCRSKSRGCNALLVLWGQMMDMAKVEVVLIDEPLGL